MTPAAHERWWERRATVVALALLAAVPLLWPTIPPLTDLPGHMGRYAVELAQGRPSPLHLWYRFDWALIGNLGVDLLIVPLAKLVGLELGVKLVAIAIPVLTVAGLLWIAREVHGEVPPTALFALPLAYGHPFTFGFINFALAMALALNAFALWLRLARQDRLRLRAALFVVIGPGLWLVHTFGWGTLGVMAFSAELVRQHDRGRGWAKGAVAAAGHCLALTPPLLLMLVWRSGHVGGVTSVWGYWRLKGEWIAMTLRDRWQWFDEASVALLFAVVAFAIVSRRLTLSRNLAASALCLAAVFAALPMVVFGSYYADMRLTPFVLALALVAIRPSRVADATLLRRLAIVGLAFVAIRLAATTASFAIAGVDQDRRLAAIAQVPSGARVLTLIGRTCRDPWFTGRLDHLPAMLIVRRQAFSNDQWALAGAQLLSVRDTMPGGFRRDPSQFVLERPCRRNRRTLARVVRALPRASFDYLWLIDPPRYDPAILTGMTTVWRDRRDKLLRIAHD